MTTKNGNIMQEREHIFAVIDTAPGSTAVLDIARDAVQRGARATLVMMFTPYDRRSIIALAEAENLTIGEAEAIYLDRAQETYRVAVGGSDTTTIVRYRPSSAKDVLAAAVQARATALAVPSSLASHRRWRSELSKSGMPVVITPSKAA